LAGLVVLASPAQADPDDRNWLEQTVIPVICQEVAKPGFNLSRSAVQLRDKGWTRDVPYARTMIRRSVAEGCSDLSWKVNQ
jgi:hypothetical protein